MPSVSLRIERRLVPRVGRSFGTYAMMTGVLTMMTAAPATAQQPPGGGVLRNAVAGLAAVSDRDLFPGVPPVAAPQSAAMPAGRVRITSGISLDQALLLISPSPAAGNPVVSGDGMTMTVAVRDGHTFTVLREGARVIGNVAGTVGGSLVLTLEDGRSVTVPRTGIVRYERPNGVPSRKRHALLGLLLGGAGGTLVGLLHGQGCVERPGVMFSCFGEPGASAAAGFLIGGGGAAAVGALWPRHERWTVVTP